MRKTIARKMIQQFADRYDYNADYMSHMLEEAEDSLYRFNHLNDIASYRKVLPAEAHATGKMMGMLHEDCGPCTQLTIQMAEEAGVAADQLEAVVLHRTADMSEDVLLVFTFALALTRQTAGLADARDAVRAKWGEAGVIEATLATQAGRLYPMVKRGLGFDKAYGELIVGGKTVHLSDRAA